MEEEKMNLRLYADVQQLEAERLKKGKTKAEEDLDSLKTDYKKLCLSMRTIGLEKNSEQWLKRFKKKRIRPIVGKGSSKKSRHKMRL
ncbi:hypothetical protein Gotur_033520 [Gossypium turneri]